MKRAYSMITLIVALSACDNGQPAGGRGYFDPPPPATFVPPGIGTTPVTAPVEQPQQDSEQQVTEIRPVPDEQVTTIQTAPATPGAPRSALAVTDPNAQLADDVTAALAATGQVPGAAEIGIDPNDDSINLALTSQEQQIRERRAAEQRRQAAQGQLVVIQPESVTVPEQDINANVVRFARETTHPVGVRRYNRPAFRDRLQSASVCRRFENEDEAQRRFLANGGPDNDRFNLDPDGDGFACGFDPERYRKLQF